jgi:hypothetical protein
VPSKKAKKGSARKTRAKAGARVTPSKDSNSDFATVFAGLKKVISGFASELQVAADEPRKYYLVTRSKSWKGGPLAFGAVMMGKAYVSYHLLPLYTHPELVRRVSPELKKRMQGKACFNFLAVDGPLFKELHELTRAGLEKYRAKNWL